MANTKSAQKAIRQSNKKKIYNLLWKKRVKNVSKTLKQTLETKNPKADILNEEYQALQKVLDKAAKTKAIHKNKASRLKSRYAKKITVQSKTNKPAERKS
jgi:small subunit ribosomal protein S20